MWDLMQRHRTGRTIMLSTHFMDEADALGSRIAIMADGKLMCCGTPMFLKKLYGNGWQYMINTLNKQSCGHWVQFTRFRNSFDNPIEDMTLSMSGVLYCLDEIEHVQCVHQFCRSRVAGTVKVNVKVTQDDGFTIEGTLKGDMNQVLNIDGSSRSSRFAALFSELEARKEELGILSFGASGTTMEDVFLSHDAVTQEIAKQYASQFDSSTTVKKLDPNDGNMSAQLAKRLPVVNNEYIIGAEFLGAPGGVLQARAFYNGYTFHGMNIALQYLLNSLVKYYAQGHTTGGLTTFFRPYTNYTVSVADRKCLRTGSTLSILIPLGMSVLMPMFVHFIVKERLVGALHMQVVSGVHPVVFWLSNLSFDFLVYLIATGLVVIAFATHKEPAYVEGGRLGLVLLVLLLYGWSFLNFIYLSHFFFSSHATGTVACIVYIVFSGVILSGSMMGQGCEPLVEEDYKKDLYYMAILPTYCLSRLVAVDRVCVGVPEQECFGLLGQNGAGKTTIFKILTGEALLTSGNVYLKGHDLGQLRDMGYCPQFDAIHELMTARETLTIGGNRRKLSTAIALVGHPHFILLDEPSSGMDAGAKRVLWEVLSDVRASGRTLLLTSHSMEECEALCTKVAIMVNGSFVCLGSTQHLKTKFAQGYTLIAKMELGEDGTYSPHMPLLLFINTHFPSAYVFDEHDGYVHIQQT
nr:hypothetical protein BaRGS_010208 [Batillaria attramentaria]